MIIGDLDKFAIVYDPYILSPSSTEVSFILGTFEIIFDYEHLVKRYANWTINVIFGGLSRVLDDYQKARVLPTKDVNLKTLVNLAIADVGYGLDPDEIKIKYHQENFNIEEYAIWAPMREIEDLQLMFFIFKTEDHDIICYTQDYGETVHSVDVPKGYIEFVLSNLPSKEDLIKIAKTQKIPIFNYAQNSPT
jgi:hypothetical protein